jgi:curli biogenesis system outer membrane secretion channel CsgG
MACTSTRNRSARPTRVLAIAATLAVAACQPSPELATVAMQPSTAPVKNIGNFNEALRCMDDLMLAQGKRDIYITSAGLPDATGQIATGTKDMLITAISKMSAKSGAFLFVDYDPTQIDVQVLSEMVGIRPEFVAPSYYIRGAITQLDSGVLNSSQSAAVSVPFLDLGVSRDQVVSVVSMDLNIGKLVTRQIIPGLSASNSVAVTRSGKGGDAGGVIGKAGLSFSIALDKSEGFHQAVRNLVELSTIEALGKLTRVPYWQCLSIEPTSPMFKAQAREWFDTMSAQALQRFAGDALARTGSYRGNDEAVARFQSDNDLVPNGRVDFDLYYRLLAQASRVPSAGVAASTATPQLASAAADAPRSLPKLTIGTSRGPQPVYRVGDTMAVQVQPSADAYVYCYYQDASGAVARIFPNRFQPDAFVPARRQIEVPPPRQFDIRFDTAGARESVACLGSDLELGVNLPAELKAKDLEPLPVRSVDEVASRFRALAPSRVDDARLPIEVQR